VQDYEAVILQMKQPFIIALLVLSAGCGPTPPRPHMSNPNLLEAITKIAADHLGKVPDEIHLDDTFADSGADDLDLVEITMAVEDQMGITISDDELVKAAGTTSDKDLAAHLTIRAFAIVADAAPKQSMKKVTAAGAKDDGTLREAQVGVFGELNKLPNPNGYVLIFIPSLEVLIAQSEQKLGRQMTEDERDAIRLRSAVIALNPEMAEEMKRKQAEQTETIGK
jgi:acyl carrier protein